NNHRAFSCCVFVLDHSRRQFDLLHVPPILFPFHAFTRLTSYVYETKKEGDGLADSYTKSRALWAACSMPTREKSISRRQVPVSRATQSPGPPRPHPRSANTCPGPTRNS